MCENVWCLRSLTEDELVLGNINRLVNNVIALHTVPKGSEAKANMIIPNLWLGNEMAALDSDFVKAERINHIINTTSTIENLFNFMDYTTLPIADSLACEKDLIQMLETGASVIDQVLNKNGKVLVHCKRGHHRSASFIAYYLMKYKNMSLDQAIYLVKQSRPTAFRRMTCLLQTLILIECAKKWQEAF